MNPGESLSMQRHFHRNEFWFVAQGVATLHSCTETKHFVEHDYIFIKKEEWHQLCNKHESPLKVIEIQYGDKCIEEDIERKQILSST